MATMKQKTKTGRAFWLFALIPALDRGSIKLIETRVLSLLNVINVLQGLHITQEQTSFRLRATNRKLTIADITEPTQGANDQGKAKTSLNVDASQRFLSSYGFFRDLHDFIIALGSGLDFRVLGLILVKELGLSFFGVNCAKLL